MTVAPLAPSADQLAAIGLVLDRIDGIDPVRGQVHRDITRAAYRARTLTASNAGGVVRALEATADTLRTERANREAHGQRRALVTRR